MDKLITVIVPVYKIKEAYLRRCLDSLMTQGSDKYKVVLVDDGSPDNCGHICDEYAKKNSVFLAIHQKNAGVSAARNVAIDIADTEWVTFVDPDDWIAENAILAEIDAIRKASGSDIIMFDYSREYLNEARLETLSIVTGYLDEELLLACRKAPFYKLVHQGKMNPYSINAIWNKVYRRAFLIENNIKFIPEARKGQDRLFNAAAFNAANRVYYLNQNLYHYRCNEKSVSNKYNKNIVELTEIEINTLNRIALEYGLDVGSNLKARVCTRLYSCMRLYYFHCQNTLPRKEKVDRFRKLVNSEPFKSAIAEVDMCLLSGQEKIFVYCLKLHLYRICEFLVVIRSGMFKGKLDK